MRNFMRLADSIDMTPLAHALARQGDLWNADRTRTRFADSPHSAVDDILLRFGGLGTDGVGDTLLCHWLSASNYLPQVRPIIFALMARLEGEQLGRVVITRLRPGGMIARHADTMGAYARFFSRYHVIIQGLPGSTFLAGEEGVTMRTGEVWWFNAAAEHEVLNNSADDRIHMLVDIRTGDDADLSG